jgi:hypothetical protein
VTEHGTGSDEHVRHPARSDAEHERVYIREQSLAGVEEVRGDLAVSAGLAVPGSGASALASAYLSAADAELGQGRSAAQ